MAFDYRRIRFGEMIAAVSGVLLFLFMFLDWYGVKVGGPFGSGISAGGGNAWSAFGLIKIILLIVAIAAVVPAVLSATQRTVALPVAASAIVTVLGLLAVLLILFRMVSKPGPDVSGIDITLKLGIFLGLLSALGIAFGGYQSMRSEGTTFDSAREQARSAVGGGGAGGPGRPASSGRTTVPPASQTPPAAPPTTPPPPGSGEPPPR